LFFFLWFVLVDVNMVVVVVASGCFCSVAPCVRVTQRGIVRLLLGSSRLSLLR